MKLSNIKKIKYKGEDVEFRFSDYINEKLNYSWVHIYKKDNNDYLGMLSLKDKTFSGCSTNVIIKYNQKDLIITI